MGVDISLDCIICASEQSNGYDGFLCFVCGFCWLFIACQGFQWIWSFCAEKVIQPLILNYIETRLKALDVEGITGSDEKCGKIRKFESFLYNKAFDSVGPNLEVKITKGTKYKKQKYIYPEIIKNYFLCVLVVTFAAGVEIFFQKSGCLGIINMYALLPMGYIFYHIVDALVNMKNVLEDKYLKDRKVLKRVWNMWGAKLK